MLYLNEYFEQMSKTFEPERQDPNYSSPEARSCEVEVAIMLYALVRIIKPVTAIETGSYRGFSTAAIATGLKDNGRGKVYSIDLKHEWGFMDNMKQCGVEQYVEAIDGDSLVAGRDLAQRLRRVVDYIHIDAVHTYDFVMKEFENFDPCLRKNGFISFHDTVHPKFVDKVGKAVDEILKTQRFQRLRFFSARGLDVIQSLV